MRMASVRCVAATRTWAVLNVCVCAMSRFANESRGSRTACAAFSKRRVVRVTAFVTHDSTSTPALPLDD